MVLCWCRTNTVALGLNCFHKDHSTLKAAGSVQARVFVSWLSIVPYMHSHTRVMNLCTILSCLLHPCCTAAFCFSTCKRKYPHHNYGINAAKKSGERQIAKRKGEQKGKWPPVWREKKEGALKPEWRVHLICNYPPRWSASVWSWLASWSLLGEKVLESLWPQPTSRQAPHDLGTLDAPYVHQSCNQSLSDVRQQMSLPVGSILPSNPWPRHPMKQRHV